MSQTVTIFAVMNNLNIIKFMKTNKVVCNIDKMTICLMQPRNFFVPFKKSMQAMKDQYYKLYYDNGAFYLAVEKETDLEENTITTHLYVEDIDNPDTYIKLGIFVFNNSKRYDRKCFFSYETKTLYQTSFKYRDEKHNIASKHNYFIFPFYVFDRLGLTFNNVTRIEIALDTDYNIINAIKNAISDYETFQMILFNSNQRNHDKYLEGIWEYYQISRKKKLINPTLYVHKLKQKNGSLKELKIYDKARELCESRPDKKDTTHDWTEIRKKMYRAEINIGRNEFNNYFEQLEKKKSPLWQFGNLNPNTNEIREDGKPVSENYKKQFKKEQIKNALVDYFYYLGNDEKYRIAMFDYFANNLLRFKMNNHDKTQVTIRELAMLGINTYKSLKKRTKE